MNRLIIIFYTISCLSCNDGVSIKPMKYNRHGIDLSCEGHYKKNVLQRVLCFTPNRDTILKEEYKNGVREGASILNYEDGSIQEIGYFKDGHQYDEWREYYSNGTLKSYRFFQVKNDTSYMIYEKLYDINGVLETLRFPLRFRTNNENKYYQVGVKYQLFVDLEFSQFDSLNSFGFIEASPESSVDADTILFNGKSIYLEFIPQKEGNQKINGTYIEIDASKANSKDGYGGEKKWSFEYEAIK